MSKYNYKTIITRPQADDMKIWELIFFLFWDDFMESKADNLHAKSYRTEDEIVKAIKEHYENSGRKNLDKISQGGISKGLKSLNCPVIYQTQVFRIAKLPVDHKRTDTNEYQITKYDNDIKQNIWDEERRTLLSLDLLEKNQLCPVSKYMYVFKMKPVTIRQKKQESEMTEDAWKLRKKELEVAQSKENAKKIKDYFRAMIDCKTLFSVTVSNGGKVTIMLNKTEDTSLYSRLLENFFCTK